MADFWTGIVLVLIAVSKVIGVVTGEWRGYRDAMRKQVVSVAVVMAGISLMGYSLLLG